MVAHVDGEDWRPYAACYALPPEQAKVFITERHVWGESVSALLLCRSCPVRQECYAWAQRTPDFRGIAGGVTWRLPPWALKRGEYESVALEAPVG